MLVLDASACVDLLIGSRVAPAIARVIAGEHMAAPALIDVEVCSALARLERSGHLAAAEASSAVASLRLLPAQRVGHEALLERAWQTRSRLRIHDAFYVACARLLAAPLVTTDRRLPAAGLRHVTVIVPS